MFIVHTLKGMLRYSWGQHQASSRGTGKKDEKLQRITLCILIPRCASISNRILFFSLLPHTHPSHSGPTKSNFRALGFFFFIGNFKISKHIVMLFKIMFVKLFNLHYSLGKNLMFCFRRTRSTCSNTCLPTSSSSRSSTKISRMKTSPTNLCSLPSGSDRETSPPIVQDGAMNFLGKLQ